MTGLTDLVCESKEIMNLFHYCYVTWVFPASLVRVYIHHVYIHVYILVGHYTPSLCNCRQFHLSLRSSQLSLNSPRQCISCTQEQVCLWAAILASLFFLLLMSELKQSPRLGDCSPCSPCEPSGQQSCLVVWGRQDNGLSPKYCFVHCHLHLQNSPKFFWAFHGEWWFQFSIPPHPSIIPLQSLFSSFMSVV